MIKIKDKIKSNIVITAVRSIRTIMLKIKKFITRSKKKFIMAINIHCSINMNILNKLHKMDNYQLLIL